MDHRLLYEKYHSDIKLQKRVILRNDFTYRNILDAIEKYLPKKGCILDIGSGIGTLSFYFASKGFHVDGIELSTRATLYSFLTKNILNLKTVNFINISIENYKPNKKYDFILCSEVLEHLKDDSQVLENIQKLMKNNSLFALSVPSTNAFLYKVGLLNQFDKRVGHLRRYSMSRIENLLIDSGYTIIEKYKTEGVLRNILFTNKIFGFLIKFTRFKLINNFISLLDKLFIPIFGESQLILICKKR